jgi:hypothetical protein
MGFRDRDMAETIKLNHDVGCPSCGKLVRTIIKQVNDRGRCVECDERHRRGTVSQWTGQSTPHYPYMTATVIGSNSFYDPFQTTNSLTVPNCVVQQGDEVVTCIALNSPGGQGDPGVVQVGGLGSASAGSTGQNDQYGGMFVRQNVNAGTVTVNITSFVQPPSAAVAIVLALRRARTTSPSIEQTSQNQGTGVNLDSGITPGLNFLNQLGLAVFSRQDSGSSGITVGDGFTHLMTLGTNAGQQPPDTVLSVAYRAPLPKDFLQARAFASAADWTACVASFRAGASAGG